MMKVRIPGLARFSSSSTNSSASSKISPSWLTKHLSSRNQNSHLTRPLYRCLDHLRSTSPQHEQDREDLRGQDQISFKLRALANGIKALAQEPHTIESISQLKGIQGVGSGILKRCEMVLSGKNPLDYVPSSRRTNLNVMSPRRKANSLLAPTQRLPSNLALLHSSPDPRLLKDLQLVRGIGPSKAQSLVSAGCRSLQHLNSEEFENHLTKKQIESLKDLLGFGERMRAAEESTQASNTNSRINTNTNGLPDQTQPVTVTIPESHPPSKTEESNSKEYKYFSELFNQLANDIENIDSRLKLHPVGSFRRGKIPQSLEVLLEDPNYKEIVIPVREAGNEDAISIALGGEEKSESDDDGISDSRKDLEEVDLLKKVVEKLGERVEGSFKGKGRKFEGTITDSEGKRVPIFIRLTSPRTLSSSLLFHTGDIHYIRFLRTLASEAYGSYFDSQGLWRRSGDQPNGWERIGGKEGHPKTDSEEAILDALGMVFLEPHERIVKPPRVNRETEL